MSPPKYGIGHQIMVEEGWAWPQTLCVASDSHSNHYGMNSTRKPSTIQAAPASPEHILISHRWRWMLGNPRCQD